MKSIPWLVVALAFMGTVLSFLFFWGQLPDEVATHFDLNGHADGWMSKTGFISFALVLQFGLAVMMFGFGWLIKVLPTSMINIPNREYWLADERRDQTLAESQSMMGWIAAGTAVMLMVMFYLSIEANLGEEKRLNATASWVCVASYLVWLLVYCVVTLKTVSYTHLTLPTIYSV